MGLTKKIHWKFQYIFTDRSSKVTIIGITSQPWKSADRRLAPEDQNLGNYLEQDWKGLGIFDDQKRNDKSGIRTHAVSHYGLLRIT